MDTAPTTERDAHAAPHGDMHGEAATHLTRAPVKQPEGLVHEQAAAPEAAVAETAEAAQKKNERAPVKFLGVTMPEPIASGMRWMRKTSDKVRLSTVKALPAPIVNNSSNILGVAHVATEIAMFKSSLREGNLIQNPKNPINWVWEPIKTVFKGVAEGAKPKDLDLKGLFKGNAIKNIKDRVTDMKGATEREYARQMHSEGVAREKVNLSNRWQTRSTFLGLVAWSLSALIPEKKESDEEIERMAIKRANHPMQYVGERIKQALWFPEWGQHKRQMLGLAYFLIGCCSTLGSWRGVTKFDKGAKAGLKEYSFNQSYLWTSLISLASSVPLLFSLDEKSGYSNFGGLMMFRIAFLRNSIKTKYKNNDPGAPWYAFSSISFQVENLMQGLFGGAQKVKHTLPDGTVVEEVISHKGTLEKAKEEAREIKVAHKAAKQHTHADVEMDVQVEGAEVASAKKQEHSTLAVNEKGELVDTAKQPEHHITHAKDVAHAMPERKAAHDEKLAAAASA